MFALSGHKAHCKAASALAGLTFLCTCHSTHLEGEHDQANYLVELISTGLHLSINNHTMLQSHFAMDCVQLSAAVQFRPAKTPGPSGRECTRIVMVPYIN